MFDCLSLVGEQMFGGKTTVPLTGLFEGGLPRAEAEAAIERQLRKSGFVSQPRMRLHVNAP